MLLADGQDKLLFLFIKFTSMDVVPFENYFRLAEQLTVVPPFDPAQVQCHGPFPVTLEAFPALQRFDVGALRKLSPFAEPQAPSRLAEQLAVVPPLDPVQVQVQGPVPLIPEAVPALQRFDVGAVEKPCPFAEPQAPLTVVL
jgi:hypothetical protein